MRFRSPMRQNERPTFWHAGGRRARPSRSKWQKMYCKTLWGRIPPVQTMTWSSARLLAHPWRRPHRDDTVDKVAKNL